MPTIGASRRTPLRDFFVYLLRTPLWAIPFTLFFGTLFGASWHVYWVSYQMSLIFGASIGFFIWLTKHFVLPRILATQGRSMVAAVSQRMTTGGDPTEGARIAWKIGICFIGASVVGAYLAATIVHFTVMPGFLGSVRSALISGMYTLLFAGLIGGINFAMVFYRQAVDRARAVEQIRAELAGAELRALRAQINPHFLFTTLNTIAALIGINPAAAEELTTRLAEVFRYALRASDHEHARLGDELAFVRSYLEIERTRFSERLRIEEQVEPGLEAAMIPSLLLQPLVENAVRHGISTRPEGGRLRLAVRRVGATVVIEIEDDGPGMKGDEVPSGTGFGLHSVRERLRAAGLADALVIESQPGRGTRVRITLPLKEGADPAPRSPKGAVS